MNCEQARPLLHAYLDDELDLTTALAIEQHLEGCERCRKEIESTRVVSRAVQSPPIFSPASQELRDRVQRSIRAEQRSADATPSIAFWRRPMAYSGLAAAVVLVLGASLLVIPQRSRGPVDALVMSHVRSLDVDHLLDVDSTDQHTVKPWFAGKLDFSPPVIDLANEGFPLIGGRLDYFDDHKVAALVYRRAKHVINLYIWPGETTPQTQARDGFNLIRFDCKGMTCWAISDVNFADLKHFTELFAAQKSASTRE